MGKYSVIKFTDAWEEKDQFTHRTWIIDRIKCARKHMKDEIEAQLNSGESPGNFIPAITGNFIPAIRCDFLEMIKTLKLLNKYKTARMIKYLYRSYLR